MQSINDLKERLAKEKRSFLLIYKSGSEQSDRAFENLAAAARNLQDVGLFSADVNQVRDIHPHYQITTAPTLLEFQAEDYKNSIKGAHDESYYRAIIENAVFVARAEKEGRNIKSVTVYSTPTCSWCNTLKSYLRKNQIRFTDIDVSRNEEAAREMTNRSGQQGVPQTLINGEIIVGFDKSRINRLLEIKG